MPCFDHLTSPVFFQQRSASINLVADPAENPTNTGSTLTLKVCLTHQMNDGAPEIKCCTTNQYLWLPLKDKQQLGPNDLGKSRSSWKPKDFI